MLNKINYTAMKRLFTFLLLMLFGIYHVEGQRAPLENITRNLVVVEIGTGTWCTFCPGAALGADDLIENGHPVAIVENHNGDAYANTYSNARNTFYNVPGYPTAYFDGLNPVVGGHHTNSMYPSYLPKVNARMGVLTPFDIDFSFTDNGNNNFTASVDVSKVGIYSNNVVLHLFVTESNIQQNWQGQTHLNFVNRLMVPSQSGTPLDFSNGNNVSVELNFDLNSNWVRDNCEIVVAVQDMSTKEIFNGAKANMLQAIYDYDATVSQVFYPLEQACGESISPRIEIKNYGGINLTSLDVEYSINGGEVSIYTWTGDIAFTETAEVTLPAIDFTMEANNTLFISLSNPNGNTDENPANNNVSVDFVESPNTSMNIEMQLFVGAWGNEISWEFYNVNGVVIAEGSGYDNNQLINMELPIDGSGCYDFYLYDQGGDGFAGGGYLKLYDNGTVFAYITNQLDDIIDIPFNALNPLAAPQEFDATANGYDINFTWTAPSKAVLQGYNIFEAGDMATPINAGLITGTAYAFTVSGNGNYEFYLQAVYDEGNSDLVGPVFADINVGIGEINEKGFSVYPNPVTDNSSINFTLKQKSEVAVTVYNMVGVRVLEIPAQDLSAGKQTINLSSSELMDGVYFVNLTINGQSITKKISVLK
jgi:hypothetical protein